MKKISTVLFSLIAPLLLVNAQSGLGISSFASKMTVPFVMPDGTKLMTDVYLPRLQDSLSLPLGKIVLPALLGGDTLVTHPVTLLHVGQQIIMYDSINGQPNPNPYQLPAIFTRTPYGKGDFDALGAVLPLLGYCYVYQDMRGAYSSEGVYFPMYSDSWNKNPYHASGHILDYLPPTDPRFSNKHEDGYNSIKCIENLNLPGFYDGLPHTNEKLNNGSIGMFGASALGNTQLQLALAHRIPDSIPALKCLMPIVATTEHYIATGYNNGVFRPGIVTAWLKGQIFTIINDNLIPVDKDRQNSVHSSADYNLPQTDSLNSVVVTYQQNKFDAATLAVDHFTVHSYPPRNGGPKVAGFYPNSAGRPDMDGSVAFVNENGEAVDPVTQLPLPNLVYSRYTNMDVATFHVSGWWDIFTEGQLNTVNYAINALQSQNKSLQKEIIGPWAHQTIAGRTTGDRTYPENVNNVTKLDLTNFSLSNLPINQILQSDLITWFRYNLNYNSQHFIGEPKFIITASTEWQFLGTATILGQPDSVFVQVPSQDYKVPFVTMMNFFAGNQPLSGLMVNIKTTNGISVPNYSIPIPQGQPILKGFSGGLITQAPYKDFSQVPTERYYVPGPDSAADAAAGYPNNYKMGNYWASAPKFPPSENIQWQKMYLHQNGSFNFSAPTQDEGYGSYVYDPDDPILTVGGSNMVDLSPDGSRITQGQMELTDPTNAPYTMDREGVIQFNSEVIQDSFTIIGLPLCDLFAKTNPGGVPDGKPTDTDWDIRICDVWPDGRVYFVQEGIVNARARDWARALVDSMTIPGTATTYNGVEDPGDRFIPYTNINTGQIYQYVYKMLPIAYTWGAGHKIRVLISSSNYTKYQANPNIPLNDGEFFRRNPGDGQSYWFQGTQMFARVAVQRVHFSPDNPTSISFPVLINKFSYPTAVNNVPENSKFDVTLYPNPASDKIQIYANMQGEHEVEVSDLTGRVLTTARFDDNIIINTQAFGKGIYFATVTDIANTNTRITKKFVIE